MTDNKPVILYLSHSGELYGAELCLLTLLTALDKTRFFPIVVLPTAGPLKQKLEKIGTLVEIVPSIKAWLTRRNGFQRFLHFLAVFPFILISVWQLRKIAIKHKADLIHTNSSVIIEGALTAKLLRIPHIWHIRELLIPETVFNFFLGPRMVLSIIKQLSNQIVTMSSGVKQPFCSYGDCSRITVVYDGLELSQFETASNRQQLRADFEVADDTLLVGAIGRVTAIKGYEDLILAAAKVNQEIPNVTFIGVGGRAKSDEAYFQKIERLIEQYNLQDSFKLVGYRNDVPDIISTLDLLVQPSHSEAFGRVLVEAMAAGKPVIGTTIGGIPEIIKDGVTGLLVPPRSPDHLAQAIIAILQKQEMALQMGEAGRQRAKKQFSAERYAKDIQKIYQDLLKQKT